MESHNSQDHDKIDFGRIPESDSGPDTDAIKPNKGTHLHECLKVPILMGILGLNMAIGGHMRAAHHALQQKGGLNSKEKMNPQQKKLRRRKRKK